MKWWIFQANPDLYNIDDAMRDPNLATIWWQTPEKQKPEQIRRDHIVLMWRSGGKKRAGAGVVGIGRVVTRSSIHGIDPAEEPYIRTVQKFPSQTKRAELALMPLPDVVGSDRIRSLPEMKFHNIFERPGNTVFELSREQWTALSSLLPTPPELADLVTDDSGDPTEIQNEEADDAPTVDLIDRAVGDGEPSSYTVVRIDERTQDDEEALVGQYQASINRQLRRQRIRPEAGAAFLFTDAFDDQRNLLIEAKAQSDRAYVRMAIGQLYDYQRFIRPEPDLALLLPDRPTQDLVGLILSLGIRLIYKTGEGEFLEESDGENSVTS